MILSWILYILALFFTYLVICLIVLPLMRMKTIQRDLQYKAKIFFFPYFGVQRLLFGGNKNQKDTLSFLYGDVKENPKLDAIIGNARTLPFVWFSSPEYLKLLQQNELKFTRFTINPMAQMVFGQSLFLTQETVWKRQRKLLAEYFHHDRLKGFSGNIEKTCENAMTELSNKIKDASEQRVVLKTLDFASRMTGEVVVQFFFSEDMSGKTLNGKPVALELQNLITEIFLEGGKPLTLLKWRFFGLKYLSPKQKELMQRIKDLENLAINLIEKRKKAQDDIKSDKKKDLLSAYMAEIEDQEKRTVKPSEKITIEEVLNQFYFLYFAGTDTTAHLAGQSFYLLAKIPESYRKIQEEMKEHLDNGPITYENLNKMVYLNAFIKETLRLYTPAALLFGRKALSDIKIGDTIIKKGEIVTGNLLRINMNPKTFPNPELFQPERWMNLNDSSLDPFSYIPFWSGPKNCIGQHLAALEAKIIIIHFIKRFRVQVNPDVEFKTHLTFLRTPVNDELVIVQNN